MAEQRGQLSKFFDEATIPQASQEVEHWHNAPYYLPPFRVVRWRVVDEVWEGRSAIDAVVVVEINSMQDFGAAQGVGGVNALDLALRRVLIRHFPFQQRTGIGEPANRGIGGSKTLSPFLLVPS